MVYKTIRVSAERFAGLKAAKEAAGCKTMGQYLERLAVGRAAPQGVPEAEIDREVERRLQAKLATVMENPEVVRLIDDKVAQLTEAWIVAGHGRSETPPLGAAPMSPTQAITDHEAAARILLDRLPEATKNFAYEICESVLHITPSQLIHGHLMAAADAGRLQAPLIDPSWETGGGPQVESSSSCEWCHQPFTPQRHGQRFCGNVCGGKAATAMLPEPRAHTQPILDAPGMQNLIAV